MKKVISAIAIGVIVITPINAFAAETAQTKNVVSEEATPRASTSFTMELRHDTAFTGRIYYMGFNPTVRVTARGNANMLYRVWVVNPAGVEGDVGYVRGDGSTIEKNLFLSIAGDYHIYVQPWSGTTNGQSSYFDFNITW